MGASTPAIAPPPGPARIVLSEGGGIEIIGSDFTLTQADIGYLMPPDGVDVQAAQNVIVRADTVRLKGPLRLPGRRILIFARNIAVTPGATIDVSGPPGIPNYRHGDLPIQTNTNRGAAGAPGNPGGTGGGGGTIGLYALMITGADGSGAPSQFVLKAKGGPGGQGQDGHPGEWGVEGVWGVSQPDGGDGAGGQGGRGGDAGDGGPGGVGGHVNIGVVGVVPASALQIDVTGGAGGDSGAPMPGAAGGNGARPRRWDEHPGRPGRPGDPGNLHKPLNRGTPGSPGRSNQWQYTVAQLADLITLPQLAMYQQQADAAFLRRDYPTAAHYYGLLLTLTAKSADKAWVAIGQAARCELSRLRQGLDFFGDRPDWAPALTLGLLQAEITAMLSLTSQLETSITTLVDAQAAAEAKRAALQAAIKQSQASLDATGHNLDTITNQLKSFEATLREQATAIGSQFQAIQGLQAHLKDDQFRHDHPGCTAMGAIQTAGIVIVAGIALDSGVGEIVEAGEGLYEAGTLMDGVKNGISLVTSVQSTIDDANKLFDALRGGFDMVKGHIDPNNHPDGGKVFATEEQYDDFLQQYMGTYLEQDAVEIKNAVHRYFEMVKARNADVLSFNALYLKRERLQLELTQQGAQLEVVSSQLAAQNDPTNQAYITYLQGVDSQVRLYLLRKIEEERHAFLYWSLNNDGSSGPGPGGPTDSSLPTLQAAHLGIAQGIDGWRESVGRPAGNFTGIQVTFTREDNPLAFKAMETTKKLALTLDIATGIDSFGPMTHVLAEKVRLRLPDYDQTQSSGALQVNLVHGGTSSFVQLDGTTVIRFSHARRPVLYWYDYRQKIAHADGTLGDDGQGYAGLSPFTDWVVDFTVAVGTANKFIDFAKLTSVMLEFDGLSIGPNLQSAAAAQSAVQIAED
jgi:hypothetical protein